MSLLMCSGIYNMNDILSVTQHQRYSTAKNTCAHIYSANSVFTFVIGAIDVTTVVSSTDEFDVIVVSSTDEFDGLTTEEGNQQ